MERGELWWVKYPPPPTTAKKRPDPHMVLLLSWDAGLKIRDRVSVAPVTTRVRGLDAEVSLDHRDGVPEFCVVNLDIIATIPYTHLERRQTLLGDNKMYEVERALHRALGIPLPCPHSGGEGLVEMFHSHLS